MYKEKLEEIQFMAHVTLHKTPFPLSHRILLCPLLPIPITFFLSQIPCPYRFFFFIIHSSIIYSFDKHLLVPTCVLSIMDEAMDKTNIVTTPEIYVLMGSDRQ